MKKFNYRLAVAALAAATMFASCESSENENPNDDDDDEIETLTGLTSTSKTLEAGTTYYLSGPYIVQSGATLTIEKGVTIIALDGGEKDYILIDQGAKIEAIGTADEPIVMTSDLEEAGAWSGLHICGYAPINKDNALSEVGERSYGGSDANDNSGTLKYVRIEYAGYAYSESTEANGFTFYGVGNGTTLEYLQAYMGADDGFEWFGGTVDAKYLVSTDNKDDAFDWTEGWQGRAQYLVALQDKADCDQTIEGDNSKSDYAAAEISFPVLANMTLIGKDAGSDTSGVLLRNGTKFAIYNSLFTGKTSNLVIDGADSEKNADAADSNPTNTSLINGESILANVAIQGSFSNKASGSTIYDEAAFIADGNLTEQTFSFTDTYVGTESGGTDMSSVDSFFDAAAYKGAVEASNDWTAGWTK